MVCPLGSTKYKRNFLYLAMPRGFVARLPPCYNRLPICRRRADVSFRIFIFNPPILELLNLRCVSSPSPRSAIRGLLWISLYESSYSSLWSFSIWVRPKQKRLKNAQILSCNFSLINPTLPIPSLSLIRLWFVSSST